MPLTAEQKKMYIAMQLKGETVRRTPGQIAGQQFIVDGIEDCVVEVLDHCAQVTVDDAKRCTITIGPCEDSLFVRDCEDCVVHAVCRQLRTRNCVRCTFYLWVLTDPIIESSHSCEFGEWHTAYPSLDAHFKAANLNTSEENLCHKIYDFTPDEPHAPHWTKAPPRPERVIQLQEMGSQPVNPAPPKIAAPPPAADKPERARQAETEAETEKERQTEAETQTKPERENEAGKAERGTETESEREGETDLPAAVQVEYASTDESSSDGSSLFDTTGADQREAETAAERDRETIDVTFTEE